MTEGMGDVIWSLPQARRCAFALSTRGNDLRPRTASGSYSLPKRLGGGGPTRPAFCGCWPVAPITAIEDSRNKRQRLLRTIAHGDTPGTKRARVSAFRSGVQ